MWLSSSPLFKEAGQWLSEARGVSAGKGHERSPGGWDANAGRDDGKDLKCPFLSEAFHGHPI